jgi:1-acyl-sn-glycerol-3-phosphate acyltransferase
MPGAIQRFADLVTWKPPESPLDRRDPDYIRDEVASLGRILDAWYAPVVDGLQHVPDGRALVVGTHNGGTLAPDMFATMVAFWKEFGPERPSYGLAHDVVFKLPVAGRWLARIGAVPAHPANAVALLERDATVLVYPGGDVDAYKPYRERHVVKFGRRRGFMRIALQTCAPIVPVVSVGAHQITYVVTDGAKLAERLGVKRRWRLEVLPITLALPWGVTVGPLAPILPLPTKVRVRVLPALDLARDLGLGPGSAGDDAAIDAAVERVRATMQIALDALVAEGDFGPRARLDAALG